MKNPTYHINVFLQAGFLPNVLRCLSHRPDELRAFLNYYDILMLKENNLSKAEKEMIVVATSAANNCMYCVVSHGALTRIYSKNPLLGDQVAINWKAADLTKRERAILEFATKIGRSETIEDNDYAALEEQGLGQEDAWDIGAIAAFFALSNRMAHMIDMRPNNEFFNMGRLPKENK
ncbi:uncharacterized protein LOC110249378 [Exaiptasia diaphana]|uniref:Carboxymuconolactone decarboxylase-like domain-containing protein n=1 Tax=Exaiptasia diaphana TaxID=2652724 RepID=A0A913XY21_EXADI|nr:uncharacterized protein LOC110249378 [Exaiptasia diaphana]